MINMDQVRTLEMKVKQTVQLIVHLRQENDSLRGRLSDTEVRLQELENLMEGLKASQSEMESGIRSALQELDHLDEAVVSSVEPMAVETAGVEAESFENDSELDSDAEPGFMDDSALDESWSAEPAESEAVTSEDPVDEQSDEPEPQQPGLGIF